MKVLTPFLVALIPTLCFSQHLTVSSTEPASLYAKASRSLSAGDTKQAEEIFKKVIDFYKKQGRVKEVPESYLGMALAFAFNGDYEQSIRFHKKALRTHHRYRCDESDDAIRLNLGLTYQLAGKDRKARKILEAPPVYSSRD
ncbi:MAG TPA: tetratricopeptide repeat protein [Chryseosolibacter sp.]